MKIKFLATNNSPDYTITGETINGLDLSVFEHGDQFIRNETTDEAGIRNAYRDEQGILHVTLMQTVIASQLAGFKAHWREGPYIDSEEYDPNTCYVVPTGVANLVEDSDYIITLASDVTGKTGWTIKLPEGTNNDQT